MTVPGKYLPEIAYLDEINAQCYMADRAFEKVRRGCEFWENKTWIEDDEKTSAPVELVRNIQSFLNHARVITRLVFVGSRKGIRRHLSEKRCDQMQMLLGKHSSPELESLQIRDSFEHIDERMDSTFQKWDGSHMSVEPIRIGEERTELYIAEIRRIDPRNMTISFLRDKTCLMDIKREIDEIQNKTQEAKRKIQHDQPESLFEKWQNGV